MPFHRWTSLIKWLINLSEKISHKARQITLPFFDNVPLYDVAVFFWKGIVNGDIATRASAIAFNFILAVFPAIIFLFTLIPYIPIENFQQQLMILFQSVMPQNAFLAFRETIEDIITQPRGGLLSFGFIASFYFSTNGIVSIISAFNGTIHAIETRSWINQHLVALLLAVILIILITVSIAMITFSQTLINSLVAKGILRMDLTYYLIIIGRWIVICALFFFSYAFLFTFAPARRTKFKFISAGGTLTTILTVITTLVFSFYINNFGKYNTLYGSIGTLVVVMMSIYFNALMLLIGFELNVSIWSARTKNQKLDNKERA